MLRITVQYFEGCPNWEKTKADLESIRSEGVPLDIQYQKIDTPDQAEAAGFRGSPTILVEGVDPFANPEAPVGLACRVYRTRRGLAGSPDIDDLHAAVTVPS